MGRKSWVVLCVLVLCAGTARAQCAAGATTKSEPAGFRAEYLDDMKALEQRVLALADAVPEEKYAWKPAEGVRSVQDVLLHIATTNYTFPRMVGVAPPQGLDLRGLSSLSTGKTKIREALAASFAHARAGVGSLPDADLERIVQGSTWTFRKTLMFQLRHASEHLGQLIAYARVNGVVPPWTEERMRQQPAKQPAKSPPAGR